MVILYIWLQELRRALGMDGHAKTDIFANVAKFSPRSPAERVAAVEQSALEVKNAALKTELRPMVCQHNSTSTDKQYQH